MTDKIVQSSEYLGWCKCRAHGFVGDAKKPRVYDKHPSCPCADSAAHDATIGYSGQDICTNRDYVERSCSGAGCHITIAVCPKLDAVMESYTCTFCSGVPNDDVVTWRSQ